jgi:hypothetical protein
MESVPLALALVEELACRVELTLMPAEFWVTVSLVLALLLVEILALELPFALALEVAAAQDRSRSTVQLPAVTASS